MSIYEKNGTTSKIQIDLTGPQGNAFFILAVCKNLSKQLGISFKQIRTEMTSSDYDNLIEVADKHFGDYIDFYK